MRRGLNEKSGLSRAGAGGFKSSSSSILEHPVVRSTEENHGDYFGHEKYFQETHGDFFFKGAKKLFFWKMNETRATGSLVLQKAAASWPFRLVGFCLV